MTNLKDLSESAIFPKGQKIADEHFIGTAWVETLVPMDGTFNCQIANVTFEPGARNNWHKHPGGQILLVTAGIWILSRRGQTGKNNSGRGRSKNQS